MRDRGRLLIGGFAHVDDAVRYATEVAVVSEDVVAQAWPAAREAFTSSVMTSPREPAAVDASIRNAVEERMATALFQTSIRDRRWRLVNVPLDALVTAQPYVNTTRVELMHGRFADGVVAALFPDHTALNVQATTGTGPTITFTTDRRELMVTAADARRDPASGALEVVFRIEPRPNYISVVQNSGRWLVRNGNHRLVAAWQLGMRDVPCIVFDDEAAEPTKWNKFPTEALFASRPPLVVDLATQSATCLDVELRARRFTTAVRAEQQSFYEPA